MTTVVDVQNSIDSIDGIQYFRNFVDENLSARIKRILMDEVAHSECEILVDGVRHPAPRLVSSFSDVPLSLDGMDVSRTWTSELVDLRDSVCEQFGLTSNYALANLYRDENDHAGWHSDKASLHVEGSRIAIISFGSPRTFAIRSYANPADVQTFIMEEGSIVLMSLGLQSTHEHSVPKESCPTAPRLSITLRDIKMLDEYLV